MTDEKFDNMLNEITRKMTPDEAYGISVATIGRDPSITDEQDAAARIPEAEMQKMRAAAGQSVTPAAPAAPATPAQTPAPPVAPQTPASPVVDGKSRTTYGGKVRVVDQNTGTVTWEDTNGNAIATPESELMRERLGGEPVNVVRGGSSWSNLAAQQKAAKDAEEYDRWKAQAAYNSKTIDEQKRMKGARNHLLAETVAQVVEQFPTHGEIRTTKDGKRRYRVFIQRATEGDNPISRLNKMNEEMGRRGSMTSIAVAQEIDNDGKPVGSPKIKYGVAQDGGSKATVFRDLDIGTVMNKWADTYAAKNGAKELEARRAAVRRFGGDSNPWGVNPAGWDIAPTAQELAAAQQAQATARNAGRGGSPTSAGTPTTAGLPKEAAAALFGPVAVLGADGKPETDINGNIKTRPLTTQEWTERMKVFQQMTGGAAAPTQTEQPTREEVLAEIQRRKAAKSSTGSAESQEPKAKPATQPPTTAKKTGDMPQKPQKKEPQPTPAQKPKRDETAEVPTTGKQQGGSSQDATLSERRGKEYEDGMKEIRATAEKRKKEYGWGGLGKWSDRDAEAYIRREEFLLKERLRKKYNAIQSAMK